MTGDPWWAADCRRRDVPRRLRPPPGRLRIARTRTPFLVDTAVHPDVIAAYESATTLLTELGHDVEEVEAPMSPEDVPPSRRCGQVLADPDAGPPDREHLLRPLTRWQRELGRRTSATDYAQALGSSAAGRASRRHGPGRVRRGAHLPTLAQPPALVGELRDDDDPAADFEAQKRFTPWTSAANVSGQPAVSLPLHQTRRAAGRRDARRSSRRRCGPAAAGRADRAAAAPWRDRRPACR